MKTLVIAPHPDDELLGCGGTLLRRKNEGATLGWAIITSISEDYGWSEKRVREREIEIEQVQKGLDIKSEHLYRLGFPAARLDTFPIVDVIAKISEGLQSFLPEEVFVPHQGDIHSDHQITFAAVAACTKWFRYPSVRRVLAYETLSETEFGLDPQSSFQPNVFINITNFIEQKLEMLRIYKTEIDEYPFPRSEKAIKSLAQFRGSNSGFEYAEGFKLLLERNY